MCVKQRRMWLDWLGWLPTQGEVTGWVQHPVNVVRSSESRAARAGDRVKLVRENVAAIFVLCAAGKGCSDEVVV